MLDIKKYFSIFALGTVILMTSCKIDTSSNEANADSVDLAPLLDKQALFEKKLNQIVKKIDNLQTSVNKIKTAAPQAADNKKSEKPQRKPADPNYVHNIPQGDSFFMGNPDAKVIITEFFDFQ